MNDVIYQYDGSLDGFLCCVYESYVYNGGPRRLLLRRRPSLPL